MALVGFPLLLIPLAICNIIAFLMPGLSFAAPLFSLPLTSGVAWAVTLSDLLLALGILMLLLEVIKGARPGAKYFMDHLLSLIVFGGAAAEFLLLPQFGTSTYFLLTLLALVDFLSSLALRTRRPMALATSSARSSASAEVAVPPSEPPHEPDFDSAPTPSKPSAEPAPVQPVTVPSDAVAKILSREAAKGPSQASSQEASRETPQETTQAASKQASEPTPPATANAASPEPVHEPSLEIQSPGLQPGSGAHPSPDTPTR